MVLFNKKPVPEQTALTDCGKEAFRRIFEGLPSVATPAPSRYERFCTELNLQVYFLFWWLFLLLASIFFGIREAWSDAKKRFSNA